MKRTLVLIAGLGLVACGGSATPESTTPDPATAAAAGGSHDGEHADGEHAPEKHEHKLPPTLDAFHDVLSPVWHSDPGAERIAAACDANDTWVGKAGAIIETEAPEGVDAAAWKKAADHLGATVEDFGRVCESDAEQAETLLASTHEAFHALMELLPKG
jgi:hypothetical protein